MANVRSLNKEKYNISNYRFRELYYYCLQYNEWNEMLKEMRNPLKSTQYSGTYTQGTASNPTANIAIKCAKYSRHCANVEDAARLADPELHEYIIYAVTNENVTFNYLKQKKNIPCERDRYYASRRKFYFYLDQILKKDN